MKKKGLKISAFLFLLAFLLPNSAFARHKKGHRNHHDYAQEPYEEKKDRTVLGSTLGFGALGAITAGAAASGKWTPVGFIGGALAGWAIGKAIEHGRKKNQQKKNHVRKHAYAY